ncbi:hypothetical protein Bbelb_364430 [Branchiostoma belcheri]|nr:hypothetical protein Bbelb_364430 [Branchiostoma belcheri]
MASFRGRMPIRGGLCGPWAPKKTWPGRPGMVRMVQNGRLDAHPGFRDDVGDGVRDGLRDGDRDGHPDGVRDGVWDGFWVGFGTGSGGFWDGTDVLRDGRMASRTGLGGLWDGHGRFYGRVFRQRKWALDGVPSRIGLDK